VFAMQVSSYAEIINLAREFNASTVTVLGGVPTFFVFFVPSSIIIQVSGNDTYRLGIVW
jgi:hypothetical protein